MVHNNKTVHAPPTIMLSSCDQSVSTNALRKIGITNYLVKPVREKRLHEAIVEAVSSFNSDKAQTPVLEASPAEEKSDIESVLEFELQSALETDSSAVSPENQAAPKQETTSEVKSDSDDISSILPETPKADSKETVSQQAEPSNENQPSNGKTQILVAEDFPLNQDVVRLMLSDSRFEPVFTNNGKEGLDRYIAEKGNFPAILMDVSMPVMDGYEAARQINKYEQANGLPHTPIIALTGHALKNDRQDCLDAGMDDYLTKPVKQSELLEKLEYYSSGGETKAIAV